MLDSSSGPGRLPLTQEITGSTPVSSTNKKREAQKASLFLFPFCLHLFVLEHHISIKTELFGGVNGMKCEENEGLFEEAA